MSTRYRVAIAGRHRMVQRKLMGHNFAAAFAAVPESEIVAFFDRGAQTRADFVQCWGDVPSYDDYARMLQAVQPDILCIATRQTFHADQIEQAVAAGVRGILCDKPLATSLAEVDRVVAACRGHNVPLLFALDRRWLASYRQLKQWVADGLVGSVTSVIAYGVPNLINHGCHWYDTALMLMGDPEPIWVSGFVDDLSDEPPDSRRHMDPPGRGQIGLSNGAQLLIAPDGGARPAFTIIGEEGHLLILNDGEEAYLWKKDKVGLRALELPPGDAHWPAGPAMVTDLVGAIAAGSVTTCDVEPARRASEIGFALHLSHAQAGRRVTLPAAGDVARRVTISSCPWGNE